MKLTHKNLIEIHSKGGAVPSSEWKTGSGNFVSKRPIPDGCIEVEAKSIETLHGISKDFALNLLALKPKTRKMIVVNDHKLVQKILDAELVTS